MTSPPGSCRSAACHPLRSVLDTGPVGPAARGALRRLVVALAAIAAATAAVDGVRPVVSAGGAVVQVATAVVTAVVVAALVLVASLDASTALAGTDGRVRPWWSAVVGCWPVSAPGRWCR